MGPATPPVKNHWFRPSHWVREKLSRKRKKPQKDPQGREPSLCALVESHDWRVKHSLSSWRLIIRLQPAARRAHVLTGCSATRDLSWQQLKSKMFSSFLLRSLMPVSHSASMQWPLGSSKKTVCPPGCDDRFISYDWSCCDALIVTLVSPSATLSRSAIGHGCM